MGRTLFDVNCSNIFLDLSPKAKETESKINIWDLIKLKIFYKIHVLNCTEILMPHQLLVHISVTWVFLFLFF